MKNIIFAVSGTTLSEEERIFFNQVKPVGFIIFARNIESLPQLKILVQELRSLCLQYNPKPLILIDQEGGKVARLKPPHFMQTPAAKYFGDLALYDLNAAKQAVLANYGVIAQTLCEIGINVNCAPVADLHFASAHEIIGDRSFGEDIEIVCELSNIVAQAFAQHGVLPIIKHIPGHGRAKADSHVQLPTISTSLQELEDTDFLVFKKLNNMPMAMTAHIIFSALDPEQAVTNSTKAIKYIREQIAFSGIIISDDLGMHALQGNFTQRTQQAIFAGCELILHCSGTMQEMREVAAGAIDVSASLAEKLLSLPCF